VSCREGGHHCPIVFVTPHLFLTSKPFAALTLTSLPEVDAHVVLLARRSTSERPSLRFWTARDRPRTWGRDPPRTLDHRPVDSTEPDIISQPWFSCGRAYEALGLAAAGRIGSTRPGSTHALPQLHCRELKVPHFPDSLVQPPGGCLHSQDPSRDRRRRINLKKWLMQKELKLSSCPFERVMQGHQFCSARSWCRRVCCP
jgi:hypothetical protein